MNNQEEEWIDYHTKLAEKDMVNSPSHYTSNGLEVIEILEMKMSPEDFQAYCLGNVLKVSLSCQVQGKGTRR